MEKKPKAYICETEVKGNVVKEEFKSINILVKVNHLKQLTYIYEVLAVLCELLNN